MQNSLLIFIDGVGIGNPDAVNNPFFKYGFSAFTKHFGTLPTLDNQVLEGKNAYLFPTDALLGVEGLPQSGTGQTSIFCGVNAPKIYGSHFGPYPPSKLLPVIREKNIFKDVRERNGKAVFVNAYPKEYFRFLETPKGKMTVTTLSVTESGMELKREKDLRAGNGLSAEITNERWVSMLKYDIPIITPKTAAERLLTITAKHSLTVFEYFLTDHAGHGREVGGIEHMTRTLDAFLLTLLDTINPETTTLLICSDHGNFENTGIKSHTLNPALTIAAGRNAGLLYENIKSIADIKEALLSQLFENRGYNE